MPLQRCGKNGWKWGDSGKCYQGPGARAKALRQGRAIEANEAKMPKKSKRRMITLTLNVKPVVRYDTMAGRDYLVVPAVIMVEGVVNNSAGPSLYAGEHIGANPFLWNGKPIVAKEHPANSDGEYIPAALTPEVMSEYFVGVMMNTETGTNKDGLVTVSTECWFEKDRLATVDNRILDAINSGTTLELSVGAFTEDLLEDGEFGGKEYKRIATNFIPDHLAILTDGKGACSTEAGCGLLRVASEHTPSPWRQTYTKTVEQAINALRAQEQLTVNELSFSDIHGKLYDALAAKYGEKGKSWNGWVSEVYKDHCIYYNGDQLAKHDYAISKEAIELKGDPVEVKREVKYVSINNVEDGQMTKKQKIDSLIANKAGLFGESDRKYLEGLADKDLDAKVKANEALAASAEDEEEDDEEEPAPTTNEDCGCDGKGKGKKGKKAPTANTTPPPQAPLTLEQYMAAAPPEIRDTLALGNSARQAAREQCIAVITANSGNKFTEEKLKGMDLTALQNLASLAAGGVKANGGDGGNPYSDNGQGQMAMNSFGQPMYYGMGGFAPNTFGVNEDDGEEFETMRIPEINYDTEDKSQKKATKTA